MTRHAVGIAILAGALGLTGLAGGTAVARADPDSPVTPIIDQVMTETPDLFAPERDEDGPQMMWGGTGMYCQNHYIHCR